MKTMIQIQKVFFMSRLKGKGFCLTVTIRSFYLLFVIALFVGACQQPQNTKLPEGEFFGKIIYDTYIVNRDSTDRWGDECLSEFNRKAFTDKLFNAVFAGKIIAYDYFTGEKIAVDKIREMEAQGEFSRKNISKIQFQERWICTFNSPSISRICILT